MSIDLEKLTNDDLPVPGSRRSTSSKHADDERRRLPLMCGPTEAGPFLLLPRCSKISPS
jgi:hypothetical protein